MTNIILGDIVRDVTSDLVGTAIGYKQRMNGNTQIILQPKSAEGSTIPDMMCVDDHQVVYEKEGEVKGVPPQPFNVELGQYVYDVVSGFKGVATERYISLNGCVQYTVVSTELSPKDGMPNLCTFDDYRLNVVETKPVETSVSGTGGFSTRGLPKIS